MYSRELLYIGSFKTRFARRALMFRGLPGNKHVHYLPRQLAAGWLIKEIQKEEDDYAEGS